MWTFVLYTSGTLITFTQFGNIFSYNAKGALVLIFFLAASIYFWLRTVIGEVGTSETNNKALLSLIYSSYINKKI